MDLVTLDVTDVPARSHAGRAVELIGATSQPSTMLAGDAGTIGYEILTRLGRRYHRHATSRATSKAA